MSGCTRRQAELALYERLRSMLNDLGWVDLGDTPDDLCEWYQDATEFLEKAGEMYLEGLLQELEEQAKEPLPTPGDA